MYEAAEAVGADYEVIRSAIAADPRIGPSHLRLLHDSGHKGAKLGRAQAGCALSKISPRSPIFTAKPTKNKQGSKLLQSAIEKNIALLVASGKDLDLLAGVHGKAALKK